MEKRELTYFERIVKTIQDNHGYDTALVFYGLISEASERKVSDEFCQTFGTRCTDELERIVQSFNDSK